MNCPVPVENYLERGPNSLPDELKSISTKIFNLPSSLPPHTRPPDSIFDGLIDNEIHD
jgi:hypothetical protein